jgi:hypothetical protein
MKILSFLLMTLLIAIQTLAAADTIDCYTATYDAETNVYFTNTEYTSSFGSTYVAKMGTLTVTVSRKDAASTNDPNSSDGVNDEGAFIRSLYFRNSTATDLAILKNGGKSFQANLAAVLNYGNTNYSPVNINERQNVIGAQDVFKHFLPEIFLDCANNATIRCPGSYHTGGGTVCTVTFFLCYDDTQNAADFVGNTYTVDQSNSSFDSTSSIAVCHNYKPEKFAGSIVPTANMKGDLAFFPSSEYNKKIAFGYVPTDPTVNCWVQFHQITPTIDFDDITSSSTYNISNAWVLVYGSGVTEGESGYSVTYSITDSDGSDTNGFRADRTMGTTKDTTNYIDFDLSFGGISITRGKEYTWSGLKGGTTYSESNNRVLTISNLDTTNALKYGIYKDTLTVTVTAVDTI